MCRSAIPCRAERLHCRFSIGGVAVLRCVAALPLVEFEAQNHGASRSAEASMSSDPPPWPSSAKALAPLSLGTVASRGPDKRADPSPKSPVPYLEVRDRPGAPRLAVSLFYDPRRRASKALNLDQTESNR